MSYQFCPHCGTGLESRRLKETEPERLVCCGCEFIFYLDPKLAAGTLKHCRLTLQPRRRAPEKFPKNTFSKSLTYCGTISAEPRGCRRTEEKSRWLQIRPKKAKSSKGGDAKPTGLNPEAAVGSQRSTVSLGSLVPTFRS
jgi:hypothetical protein